MRLVYDHPRVPTVYSTDVPDNAKREEIEAALLMLARDAHHSQTIDRTHDWLLERAKKYGTIEQ